MPDATTLEAQYMLDYFDSLRKLLDQQEELEEEATSAELLDGERAAAAAAYLDLTSLIGQFKDAHEALMRQYTSMAVKPPGQALVAETSRLAKRLGATIANWERYTVLLNAVTAFVNDWAALSARMGSAPLVAAAAAAPADNTPHLAFIGLG